MNNSVQPLYIVVKSKSFGGYRRSTEGDIKDAGGVAPDTDVLTKGGKHVFPPEKLAPFNSVKRDVLRNLSKFGVKAFETGTVFAISENDLQKAEEIIEDGKQKHNELLVEFNANYDTWLYEYIQAQKPEVQTIIQRSSLSREEAVAKFGFSYSAFIPTPVGVNGSVEDLQSSLVVQLYNEIAQSALDLLDKSIAPADSQGVRRTKPFGQRTKRPIMAAKEKFTALSFLHPGIAGSIELIDAVLNTTQQTGYIMDEVGNPANTRFVKLVEIMTDAPHFRTTSVSVVDGDTDYDKLIGMSKAVVSNAPQGDIFISQEAEEILEEEAPVVPVVEVVNAVPAPVLTNKVLTELAFF